MYRIIIAGGPKTHHSRHPEYIYWKVRRESACFHPVILTVVFQVLTVTLICSARRALYESPETAVAAGRLKSRKVG